MDAKTFDVQGFRGEDCSKPMTQAADPGNLVMLMHFPPAPPTDLVGGMTLAVVDLATGRFRRVPLEVGDGVLGCFFKDRKRVIVQGQKIGGLPPTGLYEVNLETGENRLLTPKSSDTLMWWTPSLSPDDKTVLTAGMTAATMGGMLDKEKPAFLKQPWLIDLETLKTTKVGGPIDGSDLAWLPDGKGFVLVVHKWVADGKPPLSTVSEMDLDGKVTPLLAGTCPVVLADSNLVLFKGEDDLWHTCDVQGGNVRLFADGMKGFDYPWPVGDGKHILWAHNFDSPGGRVEAVEIGKTSGTPVINAPGLWGLPFVK